MRHLTFRLSGGRFALPEGAVAAIGEDRPLRRLPRAPAGVAGLAAWRGAVVTVLDLAALLGEGEGTGGATLVRLAPPLDHTALRIAARVELVEGDLDGDVKVVDADAIVAGDAR